MSNIDHYIQSYAQLGVIYFSFKIFFMKLFNTFFRKLSLSCLKYNDASLSIVAQLRQMLSDLET